MIRLRAFEESDLRAAFELDQVCFPPGIAYSLRDLKHFVSKASAYSIVAETISENMERPALLAGFLIADHKPPSQSGSIITIDVAPEERRSGVGTLLMDAAEAHLTALGSKTLALEVAVDNHDAQAFYLRRGFRTVRRRRGYYYNGLLDAFMMSKDLSAPGDKTQWPVDD